MDAQRRLARRDLRVFAVIGLIACASRRKFVHRVEIAGIGSGRDIVAIGRGSRRDFARIAGPQLRRNRGLFRNVIIALEQGIFLQEALELLVEFERRKLQQADRLLELRGER
ncbi:hypothetical protein D3C83_32350 [compost metagenome]